MPIERETVLLDNIQEGLQLYQRAIVWAMTTSSALFLISSQQFEPVQKKVLLLGTEVSPMAAYFVAFTLFFLIGGFALSAIHRVELNLRELELTPELHKAVLLYPSLATSHNGFFRVGTVLFCPLAVITAFGIELHRTWGRLMAVKEITGRAALGWAFLLLIMLSIYGALAKLVWHPFGGRIKP